MTKLDWKTWWNNKASCEKLHILFSSTTIPLDIKYMTCDLFIDTKGDVFAGGAEQQLENDYMNGEEYLQMYLKSASLEGDAKNS